MQGMTRLGIVCAFALAGCVPGTGPDGASGDAKPALLGGGPSPVSVERDVEAPQVFNLTGQGLWDGRPSLGGVWVAHTSVKDPERVMIRNPKNGKSVVGALFRPEREMPGPGLQVSSDAAEALGLLAGQPAELTVVALRREEKPVPPEAEIGAEDAAPVEVAAENAAAESAAAPAPEPAAAPPAEGAAPVPATETPMADATAEPAPAPKKSGGLFGFLKKKPKPEPVEAVEAAPVAGAAATGAIEQTTLDPIASSAAAAIDRAEARAPLPAAASAPAAITRGYIQIGIFSLEANANRAADQMKAAGMAATVKSDQSNGKTYWRVIVGPAASVAERDALVTRVKGIGYPDAYPVSN